MEGAFFYFVVRKNACEENRTPPGPSDVCPRKIAHLPARPMCVRG